MAPEVLQGQEANPRSDIFSFGCVLYEMVTGRRAFEGKTQLSVMSAILEREPEPMANVQPTSPAALDYTVRTCLEKNPDDRLRTAHDVKLQLAWIANSGSQTGAPALPASKPHPKLWLAAIAVLTLAVMQGDADRVFRAEESGHRRRLMDLYRSKFGDHVPLIRRPVAHIVNNMCPPSPGLTQSPGLTSSRGWAGS